MCRGGTGIEQVLQDVRELIEYPLRYPEVYRHLGTCVLSILGPWSGCQWPRLLFHTPLSRSSLISIADNPKS